MVYNRSVCFTKFCVFACCLATGQISLLQATLEYIQFRSSANPLFFVQAFLAYWKNFETSHNNVPKIHLCESPKMITIGHLLGFWQMKVVAPKKMVEGSVVFHPVPMFSFFSVNLSVTLTQVHRGFALLAK